MAMDALRNLTANVPDWLKRLDDLSGQIDQRQAELAAVAAAEGKKSSSDTKSLRNKGSTESLKPKDDGPVHGTMMFEPNTDEVIPEQINEEQQQQGEPEKIKEPRSPTVAAQKQPTSPPSPNAVARDAANVRVKQVVKKRHQSASMISHENSSPQYQTRSMIIVYYDSYVQGFFDELVRYISSSRNLMRKAKMAAKVAQIKRMAEIEVPEDGDGNNEEISLPSVRYMRTTRRLGPMSAMGGSKGQPPDAYDNIDKGLEFVQSMCEHGAHQFLREGDCNDAIAKAQKRLAEVLEMSHKEIERVQREEPELAKEVGDAGKARTLRPISMRRDMGAGKDAGTPTREGPLKLEAAESGGFLQKQEENNKKIDPSNTLEVDSIIEADEGIEVEMEMPKLQYRSTRNMNGRRGAA